MAESKGFGIASLVCGILSIVFVLIQPLVGIVLGILGIIFAVIQNKKQKTGISTAGLILSIIGLILSIIILIVAVLFIRSMFSGIEAGITK